VRLLSYPEITYITLRNPDLFAAGGSTAADEEWQPAVIGIVFGLALLPLACVVCMLRSFEGCCGWWRWKEGRIWSNAAAFIMGSFLHNSKGYGMGGVRPEITHAHAHDV